MPLFDIRPPVTYNKRDILVEDIVVVRRDEPAEVAEVDLQRLKRRLDLLDQRFDNIDSMVTTLSERVFSQLITVNVTCPHCNKDIEIAIVGSRKAKR